MPQTLLPLIPDGATQINDVISVIRKDDWWTYFLGAQPVFSHPQDDCRSYQMFTAQLVCQGACRQAEIIRAFGVSKNSVLRSVKKYREEGIEAFYGPRRGRGPTVINEKVADQTRPTEVLGRVELLQVHGQLRVPSGFRVDAATQVDTLNALLGKEFDQQRNTRTTRDKIGCLTSSKRSCRHWHTRSCSPVGSICFARRFWN
jgi:transposase